MITVKVHIIAPLKYSVTVERQEAGKKPEMLYTKLLHEHELLEWAASLENYKRG